MIYPPNPFNGRHPSAQIVDPSFCVGPSALRQCGTKWNLGFSGWFRLKLRSCFSLRSFCFPHEPHARRYRGEYLSVLRHIRILIAPVRPVPKYMPTSKGRSEEADLVRSIADPHDWGLPPCRCDNCGERLEGHATRIRSRHTRMWRR